MNVTVICETCKTSCRTEKLFYERRFGWTSWWADISFWIDRRNHPISAEDQSRFLQFDILVVDLEELANLDMSDIQYSKTLRKAGSDIRVKRRTRMSFRRWNSQVAGKKSEIPKIHLTTGTPCKRRGVQCWFSRRIGRVATIRRANGWMVNHFTNEV